VPDVPPRVGQAGPDPSTPSATILGVLPKTRERILALNKARHSTSLLVFGGTDIWTAVATSKVLRRVGSVDKLDVILESSGGDLDFAIKLYKMLRAHCKKLTVIVPFWAKSAASLVALSADDVLLTPYGELGPIDAQVEDPETGEFVPAHSIGRAIDFIEQTEDRSVKITLALKLSPMLIGGYLGVVSAGEQEVKEVCTRLAIRDPDAAVQALTSKYLSHGYPVTAETLKEHGFPIRSLKLGEAEPFMQLHDLYLPFLLLHEHGIHGEVLSPTVVQSGDYHVAIWDGKILSEGATIGPSG